MEEEVVVVLVVGSEGWREVREDRRRERER